MNVMTEISSEQSFFAVFCIESVADELKMSGDIVYKMLAKESDILDGYIIKCYDVLHTQGKKYIVDDIISFMKERGVLK